MKKIFDYPTKAIIDLKAFCHNINIIRKKFPKSKIILPVKANAYGHDDILISKEAKRIKIEYLAVARINEGIKLRENGITLPIIDFGVEMGRNINAAIINNIQLSVSSLNNVKEIEEVAKKLNKKALLHLKVDTGMRRLGCNPEESEKLALYINNSPYLFLEGLYSHFARSDDSLDETQKQTNLFFKIKNDISKKNIIPNIYHLFNSGSILNPPLINENLTLRPGIMSYGYSPINNKNDYNLKPVMTLVSKVINIKKVPKNSGVSYGHIFKTKKDTILATIPLGYGDGFPRILSNKFMVTINNKNFPQRGRISMDLSVIEVDKKVKMGDKVIVFGNKKKCINDANDLAILSNTISYEITTALTERVERIIK